MMPAWMLHITSWTWHRYNRTWEGEHIAECGKRLSLERSTDYNYLSGIGPYCGHCLKWEAKQEGAS